MLTEENIQLALDRFHFNNEEDLYAAVGYQGVTAQQVANRITEKLRQQEKATDLENTIKEVQQEVENRRRRSSGSGVL